jgi:Holliday junction DNA helicase RuvA
MISRLSGTVWATAPDHVVIRVGGVGLLVNVPSDLIDRLVIEQPVELFTYLQVRENDLTLFGFETEEEVGVFRLLISVSGIGPKGALSLLSTITLDALRQAIAQEEAGILTRVPGIGPKTAKAVIFHLRDKLAPADAGDGPSLAGGDAEVIAVLTGLGFSLVEAQRAVQSLPRDEDLPREERVRRALAFFAAEPA